MNTKRPAVITIGAVLLLILALLVAGLGIANQLGFGSGLLGRGIAGGRFLTGRTGIRNFNSQNGFPQNGFPQNGVPNDQNNQGTTPNFTQNRQFGTTGISSVFRFLAPISLGLDILLLVLSVVAVIGLFKSKRWGAILAIIVSVLMILLTIPNMIRIFTPVVLIENLVRILLALAVIVLLLLPASRKAYAGIVSEEQEQAERIVR